MSIPLSVLSLSDDESYAMVVLAQVIKGACLHLYSESYMVAERRVIKTFVKLNC